MTVVNLQVGSAIFMPITDVNGNWSITIPALPTFSSQGEVFITATSLDATLTTIVTVDTLAPTLNIVSFASDNVLNATEMSTAQAITGTASITEAGQIVSISLNGKTYSAQVSVTGTWSVNVPAADSGTANRWQLHHHGDPRR
nr:hypothetical protein PJ912_19590 [Pectobacterium colocasium]